MKKKVLFIGVGTVHYINPILNRLNSSNDYEILNLVASDSIGHVGPGVYQTREEVEYKLLELPERKLLGRYAYFAGLTKLLWRHRPILIVVSDHYAHLLLVSPTIQALRKFFGIKIAIRSIPFELDDYSVAKAKCAQTRPHNATPFRSFLQHHPLLYRLLVRAEMEIRRWIYCNADGHLCYTRAGTKIFSSYGVLPEDIFTIFNSPDTERLFWAREMSLAAGPKLPACPLRIIHVGRLVEWKRVDLLISALADVRSRVCANAELIVIGDGPQKAALEKYACSLGVLKGIRFEGAVYDPVELGRYFLSSTVYVLAGMGGLSINEAMTFGMPIICSRCDGTEVELVKHNVNGLIFKEGNLVELVASIARFANDTSLSQRMGEASSTIIRERINAKLVVQKYLAAFNALLSSNR